MVLSWSYYHPYPYTVCGYAGVSLLLFPFLSLPLYAPLWDPVPCPYGCWGVLVTRCYIALYAVLGVSYTQYTNGYLMNGY